jgi:hypothetical protein
MLPQAVSTRTFIGLRQSQAATRDSSPSGRYNEAALAKRAGEAELAALGQHERPVDPDAVRRLVAEAGPALGRRLAKLPADKLHGFLTEWACGSSSGPYADEATLTWDMGNALVSAPARPGLRHRAVSRDDSAVPPVLRATFVLAGCDVHGDAGHVVAS